MSIETLRENVASAAQGGRIMLNAAIFREADLEAPPDLDALLEKAFVEFGLEAALPILTAPDGSGIGPIQNDSFDVTGTISVSIATDKLAVVKFTADGQQGLLVVAVSLGNTWNFGQSFFTLAGGPFDELNARTPYFFFAGQPEDAYPWMDNTVALQPGLNFAGSITLEGYLAAIVELLPGFRPQAAYTLSGTVNPSQVAPVAPDSQTPNYPGLKLATPPMTDETFQLGFLTIGAPYVWVTLVDYGEEIGLAPVVMLAAHLDIPGNETPVAFRAILPAASETKLVAFDLVALVRGGLVLTADQVFALMAGQTWYSVVPPALSIYLQGFGFRSFGAYVSYGDGISVSSIEVVVSAKPWKVFDEPPLELEFELDWTIQSPFQNDQSQFAQLSASARFLPALFPGEFEFAINTELFVSGIYTAANPSEYVSFKRLVEAITLGAIKIPAQFVSIQFQEFFVTIDQPARFFSMAATTSIKLPILGTGQFKLNDATLRLNVQKPQDAAAAATSYTGSITGSLIVSPLYLPAEGSYADDVWTFNIAMQPGTVLRLQDLIDAIFEAVHLPADIFAANVSLSDAAIQAIVPTDGNSATTYTASGTIRWQFQLQGQQIDTTARVALAYDSKAAPARFTGAVTATVNFSLFGVGATFIVGYEIKNEPNTTTPSRAIFLTWQGLTARYVQGSGQQVLEFTADSTWNLGRLIKALVRLVSPSSNRELPPPWDLLNNISLDRLKIAFNLNTKAVAVSWPLQVELFFGTIQSLNIVKDASGKVNVTLTGNFIFNNSNEVKWDAVSQDPPEVPGGGNSAFDLRLLALGQRVTVPNLAAIQTVGDAVNQLQGFTEPAPDSRVLPIGPGIAAATAPAITELAAPLFAPGSNWLVATHFYALSSTLELKLIFNDPVLYGLRIGLAGPKAKIFAGLEFEILYKKISDSIGVYKIVLKLPDSMRYLQFGAVTVILPVVSVEIYTNGNFKVDFGFPYNMDFSASFTVQMFPFTGSGGFYFALLNGTTSSQVPQDTPCGNFTPVVEFGFGMQVGLGKSLSYGILSAKVSITVFGIIEGVVATWRAYDGSDLMIEGADGQPLLFGPETRALAAAAATAASSDVATAYYYKVAGTIGVIGRLVGVVDFAIVKAEVNVVVIAYIQGTFEAYRKSELTLEASVSVSLTFTIDCGLFEISFDLSFSARIRESFTIGSDHLSDAPWYCGGATPSLLSATTAPPPMPLMQAIQEFAANPDFKPLATPTGGQRTLDIFFMPLLSVAGEHASSPANQSAVYSINLFISNEQRTQGSDTYRSFERLMRDTYLWMASSFSGQSQKGTPDAELLKTVQLAQMEAALAYLSANADGRSLAYADITNNLEALFKLNIKLPPASTPAGSVGTTVFPMPAELTLTATYQHATLADADFDKWTTATHTYIEDLQVSINRLIAQMLDELKSETDERKALRALLQQEPTAEKSLAAFVFVDYFALAAQYLIQAAIDAFKNYAYMLKAADSISSVRQTLNALGGGSQNHLTDEQIAWANRDHPLTPNLQLTINNVPYAIQDGDTWGSIASTFGLQTGPMAADNAAVKQVLIANFSLTINQVTKSVPNDGSIASTAAAFGLTPFQFGEAIATQPDVLQPLTMLTLNGLKHTTTAAADPDTIVRLAQNYGIDVAALVPSVAGVADLFDRVALPTLILPGLRALTNADIWNDITTHHGVTHLSGMAARYLLNGLRLPVAGIKFHKPDHPCATEKTCGLQNLTGQQFSLPSLANYNLNDPLAITLKAPQNVGWITFTNTQNANDSSQLPFNLPTEAAAQVNALIGAARAQGLQAPVEPPAPLNLVERRPRQFTFRSNIILQTATGLPLPNNNLPPDTTPRPMIWNFPVALLAELGRAVSLDPRFLIEIGSTNTEGGRLIPRPAKAYGFATLIQATVKRVALSESGAALAPNTYELVGADELGINLLERLLGVITPEETSIINNIYVLYQPNQTSARAGGLQYDGDQNYTTFLVQANLSSETNPPTLAALSRPARSAETQRGLLNGFYPFLSALWAGSIVRSGGYYFFYELPDGSGLPDSLFNEDGLANLSVLVVYNPTDGVAGSDGGILRNFMNAAVVNDPFDKSGDVIYLKSMPRAASVTMQSSISLADIAAAHHLGVGDIAAANPNHPLSTSALLAITDIVHQVARGETLAQIAARFGKTQQEIINDNPHVDFAALTPGTGLHIPDLNAHPHEGAPGLTLQAIAAYYGSTLAALAWANREVKGLYTPSQPLIFDDLLLDKKSTLPPGNVGLVVTRQNPGDDQTQPAVYLERLYNMLGYDLITNTDFVALTDALPLPSGPTEEDDDEAALAQVKLAAPAAVSTVNPWVYTFTVPASRAARNNPVPENTSQLIYPDRAMNPYAGVGGFVQLSLDWRDMMGNHTWSRFDDSSPASTYPLNFPPSRVGFTDDCIGLGQWPSTHFDHYFERTPGGPQLVIEWSFDPSRYARDQQPIEGSDLPTWKRNAMADRQVFANLYYQLIQTDRNGSAATLLETVTTLALEQPQALTSAQATAVRDYALAAWRYVVKVLKDEGVPPPLSDLPLPVKLTRAINPSDAGAITEIKVAFQMRRVTSTILDGFRDEDASRVATTIIGPRLVNSMQPGASAGLTLDWYDAQFQTAFDEQDFQLRLATGVSRSDTGAGQRRDTLWAVRIGKTNNQSYHYRLNKPAMFFAPAPLSTSLISRPGVTLYSFSPSTGLSQTPNVTQSFTGIDLDVWGRTVLDSIDQLLSPQYAVAAFLVDDQGGTNYLQQVLDTKFKLASAIVAGVTNILCKPALDTHTNAANFAAAREKLRQQLLIKLGNAYTVDAIVQHEMSVTAPTVAADDNTLPRLFGNAVNSNQSINAQDYAAGSFKIPLKNGTSLLTYTFRARDARRQASFPLILEYTPTHVEHQIAAVPGIPEYQASSWLNFIETLPPIALAGTENPPATQIDIDVPIPLRAYPTPPSLQNQAFLQENDDSDPTTTLEKAKEWTFRFIYSQVHAAQDRIDSVVRFNVPLNSGLRSGPAEEVDLVTMLARIIHVLAGIQPGFEDLLQVELDTPTSSSTFKQAQNALKAFATLTIGLDEKWRQWVEQNEANSKLSAAALNENLPFSISEDFIDLEVTNPDNSTETLRILRVTIAYPTNLLPGMKNPPLVTFDGYTPTEVEPEENALAAVASSHRRRADVRMALGRMMSQGDCEIPPDEDISRKAWVYRKIEPEPGEPPYLTWDQALETADRRVDITQLDVIQYQNAWANVRIIRNLDLVGSDNPTREPFVYRTPVVQFRNLLTPLLDTSREINIAEVPTGAVEKRLMVEHLTALFQAFFKGSPSQQQLIKIEARYAYALSAANDATVIELPLLLVPPTEFPIPPDWQNLATPPATNGASAESFIATLAEQLQTWFSNYNPSPRSGQFRLDLSAFSSLSNNTQPLVRVRNLMLMVEDIKDLT